MGCDGGSIPKRKEVVKNKQQRRPRTEETEQQAFERWKTCTICDWVLKKPVMSGHWGHLMSKECIIEHYLEWRQDRLSAYHRVEDHNDALSSFHTMKDVKELKLTDNPVAQEEYGDAPRGDYVCPITGLETNGKHKFVFPWKCGCVVSERAVKEVDMEGKCLVCQKRFHKTELVILNPTKKELEENQARFLVRSMRQKGFFKEKDTQASTSESSSSQESAKKHDSPAKDDGWGRGVVEDPMAPSTSSGRGRRTRTDRESSSQESVSKQSTSKKHKS